MAETKKHYARYVFVRGNQALWRGDPSQEGSEFRQVVVTSDQWLLSEGHFQVYALEGKGNGIVNGKFSAESNPKALFDGDFQTIDTAGEKFAEIVKEAQGNGFKPVTFLDELQFQQKLRERPSVGFSGVQTTVQKVSNEVTWRPILTPDATLSY